MRKADGTPNGQFNWAPIPIGGGGYITHGFAHVTSGIMFAGTDVCNGYLRKPADLRWSAIARTDTMSSADYGTNTGKGDGKPLSWFAWSPASPTRGFLGYNGYAFTMDIDTSKSLRATGNPKLTRWNLAATWMRAGSGWSRWWGPGFAAHPTDKDTAMLGTSNDGAYFTTDASNPAGATATQITSIAACTAFRGTSWNIGDNEVGRDRILVASDPGNASYWYGFSQGVGLHRSSTGLGASNFSLVAGGPLGASCLFVESDGTLWIVADERVSLISNYTLADLTGWTAGGSATLASGPEVAPKSTMIITNGAATAGYASTPISVVAGLTYDLSVYPGNATTTGTGTQVGPIIMVGTAPGLSDIATTTAASAAGGGIAVHATFTAATSATLYATVKVNSSASGDYARFTSPNVACVGIYTLARGGSTFTNKNTSTLLTGSYPWHVAVDPFNSNNVLAVREQVIFRSGDHGANWANAPYVMNSSDPEALWRANVTSPKMGGGMWFNPLVQNEVWFGEGFGAIKASSFASGTISFTDRSAGIEEIIHNVVKFHPASGRCYISGWDLPIGEITDFANYANTPKRGPSDGFAGVQIGNGISFACDDDTIVFNATAGGVVSGGPNLIGKNHQYWDQATATWKRIPGMDNLPASCVGIHGMIVAGNKNEVLISPCGGVPILPAYSNNIDYAAGTATWSAVTLNGSTNYAINPAGTLMRLCLASDRTRPGTFAMVVPMQDPTVGGNGINTWNNPLGGLWIKEAGSSTFVQRVTGVIGFPGMDAVAVRDSPGQQDYRQYWACQIEYVPNCPGEMLYTPHADFLNDKFFYLTTDLTTKAVTVTEPNTLLRNVRKFGFTKHPNGGSRPAVTLIGDYNGVTGIYLFLDYTFASPILIGDGKYPTGDISGVLRTFGGNLKTFGQFGTSPDGNGSQASVYTDTAHAT